jgi:Family of unknown function (DUF6221)
MVGFSGNLPRTVQMVAIGEFILARVDDDAFLAEHMLTRRGQVISVTQSSSDVAAVDVRDPGRMISSSDARRRIVLDHRVGGAGRGWTPCACGRPGSACPPCHTLRALAMEWADHPDYRAEWRPHAVPRQARSA